MSAMEHAIEDAARLIAAKTTELGSSTMRGLDRAILAARALASAGLLAPAPLFEETETDQIVQWGGRPAVIERRRRWVTDWMPADQAEGDGSADTCAYTHCNDHTRPEHSCPKCGRYDPEED